jgi:hypothetical protein
MFIMILEQTNSMEKGPLERSRALESNLPEMYN